MSVRRRGAAAVVLLAVVLLVGCAPTPAHPAPHLTARTLTPGTSPLESDRFVRAARASDLGEAIAFDTRDFTLPQLTRTHSAKVVKELYDAFVSTYVVRHRPPTVVPGPRTWLPLSVEPMAGGARITACAVDGDATDPTAGRQQVFTVTADGARLEVGAVEGTSIPCDATGAPKIRFDPPPTAPATIAEDDVRGPPN
jgi:hypothetical protein